MNFHRDEDFLVDQRGYCATKGAAEYSNLSTAWLEKQRHLGTGPRYVRFGRAVRYSYAELDRYAREQRLKAHHNAAERRAGDASADNAEAM